MTKQRESPGRSRSKLYSESLLKKFTRKVKFTQKVYSKSLLGKVPVQLHHRFPVFRECHATVIFRECHALCELKM